jgi:hypothetical protein
MSEELATDDGVFVVVRYGGVIAAVGTDDYVYFLPPITALERDHPRRRFVGVVALVAREMALDPAPAPYDEGLAQFYARILLIPNDEFELLCDELTDAELAHRFNVPLEQVVAKRGDVSLDV